MNTATEIPINSLRKQILETPISESLWSILAKTFMDDGERSEAQLADSAAKILRQREGLADEKESASDITGIDDDYANRSTYLSYLEETLESARELLAAGCPSECIGLCKYIERKSKKYPHLQAWQKYLHGAARMELKEFELGVSLLIESISLQEISYAALLLADFYASHEQFDKAFTYYSYAGKWRPLIEGKARQELEKKIEQAAKDLQTTRLALRTQICQNQASYKPYVNESFSSYGKHEDIYGPLQDNPLVSILIVSYNSNSDLVECYESILRQTYQNWEVIVIDNSDKEDASTLTKSFLGERAVFIKQPNIGFAAANNVAAANSKGDLLLLLNPDATLAEDALKELVNSLRFDGSTGIVAPKIYFKKEFLKVVLSDVPPSICIDLKHLSRDWTYKKIFVTEGAVRGNVAVRSNEGSIALEVPIDQSIEQLHIKFVSNCADPEEIVNDTNIRLQIGRRSRPERIVVSKLPYVKDILLSRIDYSSARMLLNNAGSGIREDGTPYDRGFAEEDHGQYSQKEYIQAFCGCCALIRRNIFAYRKLFIDELFAYYEDSELSYWCGLNNIPILYCPSSKVFHRHSESTSENSPTWNCLVYRSKRIYDLIKDETIVDIYERLAADERYPRLMAEISPALREKLSNYDNLLRGASRDSLIVREGKKSVAIYNTYMNSYGGGEKHILAISQELARCPDIELTIICERDFSLNDLLCYFQLKYFSAAKFMVGKMTPKLTAFYDCFINSTFLSRHISLANLSYYVVSFPGREISEPMKKQYIFLHNSDYTAEWAYKYWDEHKRLTIYPVLGEVSTYDRKNNAIPEDCSGVADKEKLIISVGRYNSSGHCKNQHLIVKSFIDLLKVESRLSDWRLRIMGSVDFSRDVSRDHFDECLRLADGSPNIEVLGNVSPDLIATSYESASLYVHAAGLGADLVAEPDKAEHFGIAVYDGLASGCVCLVFGEGGPARMVDELDGSMVFNSPSEMTAAMKAAMYYAEDRERFSIASTQSRKRAESFKSFSKMAIDKIINSIRNGSSRDALQDVSLEARLPQSEIE